MPVSTPIRSHLISLLRRFAPAFVDEPQTAGLLADATNWFSVPGGNVLLRQGDASNTILIVVSGLFEVGIETPGSEPRIVGRLGAGEVIGEMGCITGEPRGATVRALRTSEVLEINWSDIEGAARQSPGILVSICRTVVERMARVQSGRPPTFRPSTFAIIRLGSTVNEQQFAENFTSALSRYGDVFLVTPETGRPMTSDDLNQVEKAHTFVVYLADTSDSSWTRRCMREADIVLVLAGGAEAPQSLHEMANGIGPNIPIVLVLTWNSNAQPSNTAAWINAIGASKHYHVRDRAHIARIARLLTGNGFGLVLSGGGARGLAHLGVARALKENGIEIDVIMGTSIGAIIGAGIALEWDKEFLEGKIREFIRVPPLMDITIPRNSILAGRNMRKSLERWFGHTQIEDMPIPYSCISTNVTTGSLGVHRSGDLKTWIRASAAIPGVFPPVIVGGSLHVDGGVLNNMPADKIRENGAGFVLGVDVGDDYVPKDASQNPVEHSIRLLELLVRVGSIGDGALSIARRKHCDLLLVPPVSDIGVLNFGAYRRAIDAGFSVTVARIGEISNSFRAAP